MLFCLLVLIQIFTFKTNAFAQALSITPTLTLSPTPSPTSSPTPTSSPRIEPGTWVPDPEVTFVGKTSSRSGEFLNWTLRNYQWSTLVNGTNPLVSFWATIRNVVYAFFALFVLITAFVLIVTQGRSITIMKFIPRFVIIILLVTFSFALLQFIYKIVDIIQGFFLTNPAGPGFISDKNLLHIGYNYTQFIGFRRVGAAFEESAFFSLLLTKITAVTYYTLAGILVVRKIILWFFIIISPIFPLLILYAPIRNTAKIWVGEFFRWLLYAPVFAIFLSGLVHVWRLGIPLQFNFTGVGTPNSIVYPTAINILLGGPNPNNPVSFTNSVNTPDTFALYVVALIMLWIVIFLPFLLLQIFLDYLNSFSFNENSLIKQIINTRFSLLNKNIPPPPSPVPPSLGPLSSQGIGRALPFEDKIPSYIQKPQGLARPIPISSKTSWQSISNKFSQKSVPANAEILRLTNLSIPTMGDIAKYETATLTNDIRSHQETARVHETLEKIANPSVIAVSSEREHYREIRENLVSESQKGNTLAASILSAANMTVSSQPVSEKTNIIEVKQVFKQITNPALVTNLEERQQYTEVKEKLTAESTEGGELASAVLSVNDQTSEKDVEEVKNKVTKAKQQGNPIADLILSLLSKKTGLPQSESFPVVNKVQTVNLDDYEAVRKMWQENYQKLDPPRTIDGKQPERKEWIKNDMDKINQTINLLLSNDRQKAQQGREMVAKVLPFLLIGGFSQTEITAYLKAKLEAGKSVLSELEKGEEEEETTLSAERRHEEKPKEMIATAEVKESEKSGTSNLSGTDLGNSTPNRKDDINNLRTENNDNKI